MPRVLTHPFPRSGFVSRIVSPILYDMGDYWEHEVRIEKFLERSSKKTYPFYTGGSRACPPEDCGGPPGYLGWRKEATGYDAWSDLGLVAGFAADAGSLTEVVCVQGSVEFPFHMRLNTTVSAIFSVAPNNDASREGSQSFALSVFALPWVR